MLMIMRMHSSELNGPAGLPPAGLPLGSPNRPSLKWDFHCHVFFKLVLFFSSLRAFLAQFYTTGGP